MYTRTADNVDVVRSTGGSARTLALPEIGIEIPIAELYDDVALPDPSEVGEEEG